MLHIIVHVVLALQFSSSCCQLTSPLGPVCVGEQVVFSCQQTSGIVTWTVEYQPDGMMLSGTVRSRDVESVLSLGSGFEIYILSVSSNGIFITELRVAATRELNNVAVVCHGAAGTFTSTIQIATVDPPAAPSGVMTTVDASQYTPSTASITLTWSASSGADNYTIMVTPPLPSGQSLLSNKATSLQLMVLYNVQYSINITAHDFVCGGNNSTTVILPPANGCSPPSPPANGRISEHSSGTVGAMLTFQCDAGYMPRDGVTSTCLHSGSWFPIPHCEVIDCGVPSTIVGVDIEPFNDTKLNAVITFHCGDRNSSLMTVCMSNGEWVPSPASFKCKNGTLVSQCGPPTAPVNGHIGSNYSSAVEGSLITFHCGGDSPVMTSTCSNGSWIPDPADLDCGQLFPSNDGVTDSNVGLYSGISVAIFLLVVIFTTIVIIVIIVVKKKPGVRSKSLNASFALVSCQDSNQDGSEYAQTRHAGPRIVNQDGEEYSVLCHSTSSQNSKTHPVAGQGDTLVYADIGPSAKRSAHRIITSKIQDDHRVEYSTLNLALQQPVIRSTCKKKNAPCPADMSLDLDSLLIQLKPQVTNKWKQFAEAVGLSNIIQQLSKYSPDECIVEVFDQWLKSHPTKPTWRNVADILNDIGIHQLAEDILKVYETGKLPITVDMDAIPDNLTGDNGTPPPLPPKLEEGGLDCKNELVQHGERSSAVPSRPPKPPVRPPKPDS